MGGVLNQCVFENIPVTVSRATAKDQPGSDQLVEIFIEVVAIDNRSQQGARKLSPDAGGGLRDLLNRG